jgi:hypothetical protein
VTVAKPRLVHTDNHTERVAARQVLADAIAKRDRKRLTLGHAQTGIAHAAVEAVQRAVDLKLEA